MGHSLTVVRDMSDERKSLPIFVKVNRIIIGYLAAVTKTEPQLVMVNLRDMANAAIERLQGRNGNWGNTWTNVQYPGTDLKIRCSCTIGHNSDLMSQHRAAYEKRFKEETGLVYPRRSRKKGFDFELYRKQSDEYHKSWQAWCLANPDPNRGFDYKALIAEFDVKGQQSYVTMSQDDIDTFLVENILLAPPEESEDE
jgi:hypothetical protein